MEEGDDPCGKRPREESLYSEDYEQYIVFLKSDSAINKLKIAMKIFNYAEKTVLELSQINDKLFKIVCDTKATANKLIIEQPLKDLNCEFYIPFFAKYTTAIIRDIDTEYTEENLLELLNQFH